MLASDRTNLYHLNTIISSFYIINSSTPFIFNCLVSLDHIINEDSSSLDMKSFLLLPISKMLSYCGQLIIASWFSKWRVKQARLESSNNSMYTVPLMHENVLHVNSSIHTLHLDDKEHLILIRPQYEHTQKKYKIRERNE